MQPQSFTPDRLFTDNYGQKNFVFTISFTALSPWIFGATGGTGTATGVGYFVMLAPLAAGTHTIHYTAAFKFSDAPEDYIGVDMTYYVTVQ